MTVLQGDLVTVTADAIVHPTNASFYMGGEVGEFYYTSNPALHHTCTLVMLNNHFISCVLVITLWYKTPNQTFNLFEPTGANYLSPPVLIKITR